MDKLIKTKNCCINVFTEEAIELATILDTLIDTKCYSAAEDLVNKLNINQYNKDKLIKCINSYKDAC